MTTTEDGPSARVWDLRVIRRQLRAMGLDWEVPRYSGNEPADPSLSPLPAIQVDIGVPAGELPADVFANPR